MLHVKHLSLVLTRFNFILELVFIPFKFFSLPLLELDDILDLSDLTIDGDYPVFEAL
jgi:hypothetical protein